MQLKSEKAHEVAADHYKFSFSVPFKLDMESFLKGIDFAEQWISVDDEMPEDNPILLDKHIPDIEQTVEVLVMTEEGSIVNNRRLKTAVEPIEWLWFMGIEGETIIKWRQINVK
jgi:hypothetical protein